MTEENEEIVLDENSVGLVETKLVTLFQEPHRLALDSGHEFGPIVVAYETYGTLTEAKDNAIFVCHALTGDAHVAGYHSEKDRKPGWWDDFVGPGKGLDTNKHFIICANVLSGCKGTTGPASIDPTTNKPYGLRFPFITVGDIVNVHAELVRHLKIDKLLSVIGGSLGGMQVLQWAANFPDNLHSAVCLASAGKLSAQGIAFNAVGRRAILADPKFNGGDYYDDKEGPRYGLALARMVAHITYLSEVSIESKFGRRLQRDEQELSYDLAHETEFQVESYLHYQGKRFVERFDANSYLCLTHAMDYFELAAASGGSLAQAFESTSARFLITSYTSDWLFKTAQSQQLVSALLQAKKHVTFVELESSYGHDAFLLEIDHLENMITPFLKQTLTEIRKQPATA